MQSKPIILLFSGLLIKSAFAAHPLSSEDSAVQGAGKQQVEINTDQVRYQDKQQQIAALTYTYGLRDELDLFANLPANLSAPSGVNDISVGSKWLFKEVQGHALAFKGELFLPSGDQQRGLGLARHSLSLGLVDSYQRAAWTLHSNLGLTMSRYQRDVDRQPHRKLVWRASAAAVYQVNARWVVLADTGLTQADEKAVASLPAYVLAGVIYSPDSNLDLDAGLRRERINGRVEARLGVGLAWRY
ncbi:MAG: transporter [Pseudomonadota bacterium]